MSITTTGKINEKDYNDPIVPLITIKNRSSTKTILEHNVLNENDTSFSPISISLDGGIKKTASFTIRCYDDYGYLRSGMIPYRARVSIKAKKPFQDIYEDLITGLILDIKKTERYKNGNEEWEISGQSMKHIWGHTIIEYEKNIPFLNMKENNLNLKNEDKNFYIGNILKDIFTRKDIFPNNNGYSLQERGGHTINGIDTATPITIPSTKYTGTADSLINQLCDSVGFIVGVDESNDVYARFPTYKSTGHQIKTESSLLDNTDFTCYTRGDITMSTSTDPNVYAEVIIGQAEASSIVSNNSSTQNYTSLAKRDIAQQVDLRSTELYDLTLILSKVNSGTDSNNPENTNLVGYIAADNNNTISTDIVAEISIALRDIPTSPEPISRHNVKYKRPIDPTKKYWLVIQKIGSNEDNTVLWWHDNGEAAKNGIQTFSAIRNVPFGRSDMQAYLPYGWIILRNKQVYSHAFTLRTPVLHVSNTIYNGKTDDYADPAPVEVVQSPTYVTDSPTLAQYLAVFNEYASRIVKSYDFGNVSIPNVLLRPGSNVVYIDTRGQQHSVNITDVSYNFDIGEGLVFGSNNCKISGVGFIMPTAGDSLSGNNESEFYCY